MSKRYQVFVSSTFADLVDERLAVSQALLSLDHFPAGMELFPASDDDQWALIKGVIDDSDYYVIVVAGRYGSVSDCGISYTEMEFDYASSIGIPILAFLHDAPDDLPVKKTDQNDGARQKLEALKEKIKSGRHVKFWSSPDDLRAKVIQSVSAETKRNPRIGWVRADQSSDPQRLNELMQENEKLKKALSLARFSPPSGSEALAKGSDKFKLQFEASKVGYGDLDHDCSFELSWDRIFYELGPIIMDESNERTIRRHLSTELPRYEDNENLFARYSIDEDTWQTIKVQMIALGLMQKSTRKHVPSDTNVY